jgi:ribonucleotide reductase beta subunit family protein with ferritin-like domain
MAVFWTPEEIDLAKDMKDWEKLSDNERHFIKHILGFFAGSDGIVMENLSTRFTRDVQWPEARHFYACQNLLEAVHSEVYSLLIDTYIKDRETRGRMFSAIKTVPCIQKKADWARKWISGDQSFSTRLIAFACVEGIFFSSSFAAIYWIKKRGLMPGLTLSNEFISRDEALHTEFAIMLYSKLLEKTDKTIAQSIVKDAVEIEKEFITVALPCRMIGMNMKLMSQYVEFVGDRLCVQLGLPKIYGVPNPLDFMELISVDSKVNFFERTNSEYAMANKEVATDVFDFNADF